MKLFLGDRLRRLRGDLSQGEMASKLATKQTTYSAWERNAREPDLTTLCAIADQFGVTSDWLLCRTSLRQPSDSTTPAAAVAEPSLYTPAGCRGCAERDSRIDKLLDILHHTRTPK
jgi:transcriptional regulator with XRE-family HTH domain